MENWLLLAMVTSVRFVLVALARTGFIDESKLQKWPGPSAMNDSFS